VQTAEYFAEKADQCFRVARFARTPEATKFEVAINIESMGNEFMTKAVEVESIRQKTQRKV
jgi:hypothetical protein